MMLTNEAKWQYFGKGNNNIQLLRELDSSTQKYPLVNHININSETYRSTSYSQVSRERLTPSGRTQYSPYYYLDRSVLRRIACLTQAL